MFELKLTRSCDYALRIGIYLGGAGRVVTQCKINSLLEDVKLTRLV